MDSSLIFANMAVCVMYYLVYLKKKEDNTHKDIGYRLVFGTLILMLLIPMQFL